MDAHPPGSSRAPAPAPAEPPASLSSTPETPAAAQAQAMPSTTASSNRSSSSSSSSGGAPFVRRCYTPQFATSAAAANLQRMHQSAPQPLAVEADRTQTMPMPKPIPAPAAHHAPSRARPCSVCHTASSSLFNPVVQCRRCAGCWHRLCHAPAIPDYVAATAATASMSSSSSSWTCPPCAAAAAAKNERRRSSKHAAASAANANSAAQVLSLAPPPPPPTPLSMAETLLGNDGRVQKGTRLKGVSWAHRSLDGRRAYVAGLAPRDMAYWLLQAVETYPDFAMFPAEEEAEVEAEVGAEAGVEAEADVEPEVEAGPVRAPQYRNGIINSIRKSQASVVRVQVPVPRRVVPQAAPVSHAPSAGPWFKATAVDADEDPTGLMNGWPTPGRGLYAAAGPDWLDGAALADSSDHASFSSMVYDESGHKVRENGMPLLCR